MADYHPLISRAVAGLDKNTGENRRVLYERARTALVNQLRSVEPPLNEGDITRERLALEEAIRKVEAEAAARKARPEEEGEDRDSLRDQGLRSFRDTVAEAQGLGDAATEANRSARASFGASRTPREPKPAVEDHAPAEPAHAEPAPAEHYFEPTQRDETQSQPFEPPPVEIQHPHGEHYEGEEDYARPSRTIRFVKIAVILLIIVGIAGAAYSFRHPISSWVAGLTRSSPTPKPRDVAQQPAGRPKITDRIGADNSDTANAPAAAVAQKVVLYDEDPSDPQGKRYVGSALWRTETVSPGSGLAPELAVRADVEIPERRMRMTWSLRRNTDKALPASHTIEVMFTLPADFPEGGIGNVPGVLMKQNEQARGQPLAGLAVKVTNGYFLIGLSAVDVDLQRNIDLLKNRDWFDIPIVYGNGKRAILAVEKGTPGSRAFEEAFRTWGQ